MKTARALAAFAPLAVSAVVAGAGCSTTGSAASGADDGGADAEVTLPFFMPSASVFVDGHAYDDFTRDCTVEMCRHNENTDMIAWGGAIWLVHRSAMSQTLGPNSALHVYQSTDRGASFQQTALIPAPADRDIRDPCFYVVGGKLFLKALTRLPSTQERDTGVDTVAVGMFSEDGTTWSAQTPIGPHGWSFWRIKESLGTYYTAAYQDGDQSVVLYRSTDGLNWSPGPLVYGVSADTPLETELTFMPNGKLLALVRMDGTDADILGNVGPLRTKVCWSDPPYTGFACPAEFQSERLDGPLTFWWRGRLFVVARKHLQPSLRKRTSLYELRGDFDGGELTIGEWGELPSAGDTSYAGVAMIDDTHAMLSWYSGDLEEDQDWTLGMFNLTSIWLGTIDLSQLQ
ncbi:MAG TPA: sialidase family protein [Polyangiaceae bacterium]